MTEMRSVDSSLISKVGFNPQDMELVIKFKTGGTYIYKQVREETYRALLNAESIGKYFLQHIKPNFTFRKEV